jgi:hypothetical protein
MNQVKYYFSTIEDGNLSYLVDDLKQNVDKNRQTVANIMEYKDEDLVYMNQIHGNNVQIVDKNSPKIIENCDGIITKEKNILFFDEIQGVIAAVHAGRNSTFLKIAQIAANKMINELGCNTNNIKVIFGPSIQSCCYEVSDELLAIVKTSFGEKYCIGKNIDLQGINIMLLEEVGIRHINVSNICTKCSNEPYFSFRKNPKTGRFSGVISLVDKKLI